MSLTKRELDRADEYDRERDESRDDDARFSDEDIPFEAGAFIAALDRAFKRNAETLSR